MEKIVVTGSVNDAASGGNLSGAAASLARAVIADPSVTVSITGDDAGKIYDGAGVSLYDAATGQAGPISAPDGLFTFYVRATAADFPLALRIVAKADGHTTSSSSLIIDDSNFDAAAGAVNSYPVKINLLKTELTTSEVLQQILEVGVATQSSDLESTGAGQAVESDPITGATTTVKDVVLVTQPVPTQDADSGADTGSGQTVVTIPSGTMLVARDEIGQQVALDVSTLSATATYHNPIGAESLETFPGGLDVVLDEAEQAVVDSEFGSAISGETSVNFVSGGFASVDISDGDGNKVKAFDQPIIISLVIPQGTLNPDTGVAVAAGDIVPLWSYDTDTGKWSVQKLNDGTVIKGVVGDSSGDGILDGSDIPQTVAGDWNLAFKTDHLSYFNVDWFRSTNCTAQLTVKEADTGDVITDAGLFFELRRTGGGWSKNSQRLSQGGVVNILRAPADFPVHVTATSIEDPTIQWSQSFDTLCPDGGGSVSDLGDIVLDFPNDEAFAPLDIQVRDRCSNDTAVTTPVPSVMIYIIAHERVADPLKPWLSFNITFDRFASTEGDGSITIPGLKVGKQYYVIAQNRETGTYKWDTVVVPDGGTVRQIFFDKQCEEATGSTGGSGGA